MLEEQLENIVAVDCGSVFTKAIFIERTDGVFRLHQQVTVPSNSHAPNFDVSRSIIDALKHLAIQNGKNFLTEKETPNFKTNRYDDGIGAIVSVVSATAPLRVLLAGAMTKLSMSVARRAVATAYAKVVNQISLDDEVNSAEARIACVHETQADVLLLVGGTNDGATAALIDLAQVLAMAIRTMPTSMRPVVIFAGNQKLRAQLATIFGRMTDFKPIDNILPSLGKENIGDVQRELAILYRQMKLKNLSDVQTLTQWSANAPASAALSFAQTIHYLGKKDDLNLLGVDVGSASMTLSTSRDGQRRHFIRPDLGMSDALPKVVVEADLLAIARWVPFEVSIDDLRNYLANRHIFPQFVATSFRDVMIDMALMRFMLQKIAWQAQVPWHNPADTRAYVNWDILIGAGQSLVKLPHLALAMLVLLDTIQPIGVSVLALDSNLILSMLGALASVEPMAATHLARYDSLLKLATVIIPFGTGRLGKKAVNVSVRRIGTNQTDSYDVDFGTLKILPNTAGANFEVDVKCTGKMHLKSAGKTVKKLSMFAEGGELGIIIDTRGRPLPSPIDEVAKRTQLQKWLTQIGLDETSDVWCGNSEEKSDESTD